MDRVGQVWQFGHNLVDTYTCVVLSTLPSPDKTLLSEHTVLVLDVTGQWTARMTLGQVRMLYESTAWETYFTRLA